MKLIFHSIILRTLCTKTNSTEMVVFVLTILRVYFSFLIDQSLKHSQRRITDIHVQSCLTAASFWSLQDLLQIRMLLKIVPLNDLNIPCTELKHFPSFKTSLGSSLWSFLKTYSNHPKFTFRLSKNKIIFYSKNVLLSGKNPFNLT